MSEPYYGENGRCPHGIRRPHACDECDAALFPAPKADGLVEELKALLRAAHSDDCVDQAAACDDLATFLWNKGYSVLAALKDRDVVLEEAAERAAFVAGYRAAHMVPDAYDSTSAAEEAWEGYRLVSRNLKERV